MKSSKMTTGVIAGVMLTAVGTAAAVKAMRPKNRAKKKIGRALKAAGSLIDSIT